MNKWIEILLGLILIIVPIVLAIGPLVSWGIAALELIKGGIVVLVVLIGLLFLMLGISDLRE